MQWIESAGHRIIRSLEHQIRMISGSIGSASDLHRISGMIGSADHWSIGSIGMSDQRITSVASDSGSSDFRISWSSDSVWCSTVPQQQTPYKRAAKRSGGDQGQPAILVRHQQFPLQLPEQAQQIHVLLLGPSIVDVPSFGVQMCPDGSTEVGLVLKDQVSKFRASTRSLRGAFGD